jgi:hypothetical protein
VDVLHELLVEVAEDLAAVLGRQPTAGLAARASAPLEAPRS